MERKHQFQMQLRLILNLSARPINTYKINLKSLKSPSTLKLLIYDAIKNPSLVRIQSINCAYKMYNQSIVHNTKTNST